MYVKGNVSEIYLCLENSAEGFWLGWNAKMNEVNVAMFIVEHRGFNITITNNKYVQNKSSLIMIMIMKKISCIHSDILIRIR